MGELTSIAPGHDGDGSPRQCFEEIIRTRYESKAVAHGYRSFGGTFRAQIAERNVGAQVGELGELRISPVRY